MVDIQVSELAVYPLKSAAQIPLRQTVIDPFGFQFDRRWMVVDAQNRFLSQRDMARMCLIKQSVEQAGLTLRAPSMTALFVQAGGAVARRVSVWRDECDVLDCGDEAARWISDFLQQPCRMVYFPDHEKRWVDKHYASEGSLTAFTDGFPILLLSQASLDDLNARMAVPLEMKRFRPNLVVSGCAAFDEDNWRGIRIGDVTFDVVKPCSRCMIPSIDPDTGERSGAEPTRTLLTYRKKGNKVYFGQNVLARAQGAIAVGMPVEVLG